VEDTLKEYPHFTEAFDKEKQRKMDKRNQRIGCVAVWFIIGVIVWLITAAVNAVW